MAVNIAAQHCRSSFEPHVTLHVFQMFRTNDTCRRTYLKATGATTGFERDHPGKAVANPAIGKAIAQLFGAAPTGVVDVQDEFIESYSVLSAPD
jgi:hypothetical protein